MPTEPLGQRPRSEAQYRITFDGTVHRSRADLLVCVRDVLYVFQEGLTEIRIDAATGILAVYVLIPADVPPETLDRRADALREKWRAEEHAHVPAPAPAAP